MPPRRSNPLTPVERQNRIREKRAEGGLVRKEFWISQEAAEDEAFLRARNGTAYVPELIAWALRKARQELYKEDKAGSP